MIIGLQAGDVLLRNWNIIEILESSTRHFVGLSVYDDLGRVSTPIIEFNNHTGRGNTKSGSAYIVQGEAGIVHSDAQYVLDKLTAIGNIEYKWIYPLLCSSDGRGSDQ